MRRRTASKGVGGYGRFIQRIVHGDRVGPVLVLILLRLSYVRLNALSEGSQLPVVNKYRNLVPRRKSKYL
jgi:hypothetical protein